MLGAHFATGGSSSQPSLIEVQAAVDEAAEALTVAGHSLDQLQFSLSTLESEREEAKRRVDVALAKLHESDATLAAVAEELGQFGSQARSARSEATRLEERIANARAASEKDAGGLAELEARGLSVPEDVSVVSVGASFDMSALPVALDSIPLVPAASCDLAVDLALQTLGADRPEPGVRLIPPTLTARGSIAAPRSSGVATG